MSDAWHWKCRGWIFLGLAFFGSWAGATPLGVGVLLIAAVVCFATGSILKAIAPGGTPK